MIEIVLRLALVLVIILFGCASVILMWEDCERKKRRRALARAKLFSEPVHEDIRDVVAELEEYDRPPLEWERWQTWVPVI
jgi:hypothetical protein